MKARGAVDADAPQHFLADPVGAGPGAAPLSRTPLVTRSFGTARPGFWGEINPMSGQTVFLTAVVTQPMRYIAVERDVLRPPAL